MYVLFYPEKTLVRDGEQTGVLCNGAMGFHSAATIQGDPKIIFSVIPNCRYYLVDPNKGPKDSKFQLDNITVVTSHEVMEGLADPLSSVGRPAFTSTNDGFFEWSVTNGGGEIGDMCARSIGGLAGFSYQPPDLPYLLQRTWSNSAAAAGHDPCVPTPPGAYFNSAPVLPDVLTLPPQATGLPNAVSAHTVKIPVGQSVTVPVQLFSDGATDSDWTIQGYDVTGFVAGLLPPNSGNNPKLTFAFDKDTGRNGDTRMLTITNQFAGAKGVGVFQLLSSLGDRSTVWTGTVTDE
jgi:hypothetical protein